MKDDYCPAYFETVFVGDSDPATFPREFAIITACAPTGQRWPAARNRVADERLKFRLRNWTIKRITGQSPDGAHAEPGWLVPCTKRTAVQIGREFLQDAIYWVSGGELFILDTSKSRATERAGQFLAKYRIEAHNPTGERLIVGADACSRFLNEAAVELDRREFLFSGEASESPYHAWSLGFCLLFNVASGVWGLEETELPCGNDGDPEDGRPLGSTIVALTVDSTLTPEAASVELLGTWRAKTARWIEGIIDISRLGRKLPETLFD